METNLYIILIIYYNMILVRLFRKGIDLGIFLKTSKCYLSVANELEQINADKEIIMELDYSSGEISESKGGNFSYYG